MDSLGIPESRFDEMLKKEPNDKWTMIKANSQISSKKNDIIDNILAQNCIQFLKGVLNGELGFDEK